MGGWNTGSTWLPEALVDAAFEDDAEIQVSPGLSISGECLRKGMCSASFLLVLLWLLGILHGPVILQYHKSEGLGYLG